MIPKSRLDALTDGVFAVAMTLLVIDLRLPENFHPVDASELLHGLAGLWNQALVYVISFYVLSLRWTGLVRISPCGEMVGEQYTRWALVHLLPVTLVPFATTIVARYISLAPAIWLFAANIVLFALIAVRMNILAQADQGRRSLLEDQLGLIVLIVASILTIAASLVIPKWAMLVYLVNLVDGPPRWLLKRQIGRSRKNEKHDPKAVP
jgi:uncharacterized membrane protein